jgi:gluconolactonase
MMGIASLGLHGAHATAAPARHEADFVVAARGLQAPEGPKVLPDGSVLVCEMARGTLSRVLPDGSVSVVAELGGSPNGEALGPDGAVYVVNNGGMTFRRRGELLIPDPPAKQRSGGALQRVELNSGRVSVLYSQTQGHALRSPNDIVFDHWGGCWFTDPGVPHTDDADSGAVFWANPDGSELKQVWELAGPNGIAFSPDRKMLYVALTGKRTVVACEVAAPGRLVVNEAGRPRARDIITLSDTHSLLDSMAVEADGTLVVGTLFTGCLSLISPAGKLRDQLYFPEQFVTNLAFGGTDLRTAFVTLTTSGQLARVRWPRPGLRLAFQ